MGHKAMGHPKNHKKINIEFIPAPLAETNERSSATEKGTWIDLKELIMKNLTSKIF
jgi:hypothetical protein